MEPAFEVTAKMPGGSDHICLDAEAWGNMSDEQARVVEPLVHGFPPGAFLSRVGPVDGLFPSHDPGARLTVVEHG